MAKFFWDLRHGRSHASSETSLPERLCLIGDALKKQDDFLSRKMNGDEYNFFLFVEHDKVYTCTPSDKKKIDEKNPDAKFLRVDEPRGLPAYLHILSENRGGSIMYHGPGQIVCYMILCMEDLGIKGPHHLATLIDVSIKEFLKEFGIVSYTTSELCKISDPDIEHQLISRNLISNDNDGNRKMTMSAQGVWVLNDANQALKIASRGIRLVSQHCPDGTVKHFNFTKYGFSINISTDLTFFDYIYPCGEDIQMTSVKELTGQEIPLHTAIPRLAKITIKNFENAASAAN